MMQTCDSWLDSGCDDWPRSAMVVYDDEMMLMRGTDDLNEVSLSYKWQVLYPMIFRGLKNKGDIGEISL